MRLAQDLLNLNATSIGFDKMSRITTMPSCNPIRDFRFTVLTHTPTDRDKVIAICASPQYVVDVDNKIPRVPQKF